MATKVLYRTVARKGERQSSTSHKSNSVEHVPLFTTKIVHGGGDVKHRRLTTTLATGKLPPCNAVTISSDASIKTESATTEGKYTKVENVVVVGSGPAGYTAAIYAGRANLKPLVFEGLSKGGVPGGQLMGTTEVENFPGFPDGITGPDLMERMRRQAERWGAELVLEDVEEVNLSERPFRIKTTEREIRTHSLIVSTGATANRLRLPSEPTFWGRGISACAVCDGASPLFRDQEVGVVGGGDTAAEEALYLTKYSSHIHMFVRSEAMRASKQMQMRVLEHPKITVYYNSKIADVYSENGPDSDMSGVIVINKESNSETKVPLKGLFYGIGHTPNSTFLNNQVKVDNQGFVSTSNGNPETSVEGVFAAGDLQDKEFRQAIVASGSGCMAAMLAERYLAERGLIVEYVNEEKKTDAVSKKENSNDAEQTEGPVMNEAFDLSQTKFKGQYALRKLYHETEKPLVVLYTSPGCGPCRSLKPMIHKVVDEFEKDLKFVEIDIAADKEIAEAAGVTGTPVVHMFKKKARVEEVKGVRMKSEYRTIIEKLL